MKRIICVLLAVLLLSACAPAGQGTEESMMPTERSTEGTEESVMPTDRSTEGTEESVTPTEVSTERPGESAAPTEGTEAGGMESYGNVVCVDKLGRVMPASDGDREGRYVGCFYWLWHGQHPGGGIYDISKLLREAPQELWDTNGTANSPVTSFHWWSEPLYGYYSAQDEWVLRRHLEMLTYAGVDFLAVDLSNGVNYIKPIKLLMSLIQEYRAEGFDCPQITFFTHINSKAIVEELYDKIYSRNYCPEAWWCPYKDGKPYMIAYPNPDTEGVVTGSGVKRGAYSKEISGFFHFKAPQWPDEEFVQDAFPWIDWGRYPQAAHKNVISISPASGPGAPMSHALLYEDIFRSRIWGRGWNGAVNDKNGIEEGTFFQSQWDYAIENDPEIAFVDGWNEWIAQKNIMNPDTYPEVYFADAVDIEFSRDCEPMKGGYGDNYLMQMAENIRRFKGTASTASYSAADRIDWKRAAVYRDFGSDNSARSSYSSWGRIKYVQQAGRVNIQEIRVLHDETKIYFRITAQNDIGERFGRNWMNLFIGTGEVALKGWEGYEFVINRSGQGSIDRLNPDFTAERAGTCTVKVDGNTMYITAERAALGLTGSFSLYFKAADSVENPQDISDYYVSGQSVPMGRFSFWYKGE